ncbi:MAG: phage holin family protein [Verrucomicrobiae bacterium]|nr:phage holin family protein [Verrucomicrobiae bacterium]
MIDSEATDSNLGWTTLRLAQHALAAGGTQLELLMVELQEERERMFRAFALLLGVATLALLVGIAFTASVVVVLWPASRVWPLAILMVVYAGGSAVIYRRLQRLVTSWESLPETLGQLRRDGAALSRRLQ